jgi:ATP-dependent RNA helicase RhlE
VYTGPTQQDTDEVEQSFDQLGLDDAVLDGIDSAGFVHPTPIQAAVIPMAVEGRDVIGLAETGSGKTAAFVLPMVQRLPRKKGVKGLILSPTREIALQTQGFLEIFGKGHGLTSACVIGGVKMGPQISRLRKMPDIVVATPGRLLDHMERENISLDQVSELVLDEADHMLDLGFLPQINAILSKVPRQRHTMMFSATMPPPIERLAQQHLNEPERVDLRPDGQAAAGLTHRLYLVEDTAAKKACIEAILEQDAGTTLVFIRRKVDAEWLTKVLEKKGHPVGRIHSDRSQKHRVEALEGFREGEHRILVATSIAARGIDVPGIEHIVNYDLPDDVEDYIHRAGRTARGSNVGVVSSIATWRKKPLIKRIEATLGIKIERCEAKGVTPYKERGKNLQERRKRSLRR